MTTRIALLRGINLAGRNKVPMADLRELATEIGFEGPETYVQSGNLIFETELDEAGAVDKLEEALEHRFGFKIPVVCRTSDEIHRIAASHPFSGLGLDDRLLQVAFFDKEPAEAITQLIDIDRYAPDRLQPEGRHAYLAYPDGSARSKLDHGTLERRLRVSVTLRNWRTVSKLDAIATDRDA